MIEKYIKIRGDIYVMSSVEKYNKLRCLEWLIL